MASQYDSLIQELKSKITDLSKSESDSSGGSSPGGLLQLLATAQLLPTAKLINLAPTPTIIAINSPELNEIIYAFQAQSDYTNNVSSLFTNSFSINATLEQLNSAINLVQLYFQVSKPLPQILSDLIDNIALLDTSKLKDKTGKQLTIDNFRQSVQQILDARQALQKTLNRVVREFGTEIDEQDLQKLLQRSSTIFNELNNLNPTTRFEDLSPSIQEFLAHLKKAQELFKKFNRQDEDLTGNEPDEIQHLIRKWGDAIKQIETLEKGDLIKTEFNNDARKSREAIAQSIKIHELLEQNYDYLTTLVRSGDLESAGIL